MGKLKLILYCIFNFNMLYLYLPSFTDLATAAPRDALVTHITSFLLMKGWCGDGLFVCLLYLDCLCGKHNLMCALAASRD